MHKSPVASFLLALSFCIATRTSAQTSGPQPGGNLPVIVTKAGRHELLVDGKPWFMLGGQAHNSSGWPSMLPHLWESVHAMHANTLEVPIYWEQIEPQPGKFDFSLIDTLLLQARAQQTRLVLLWFATWKNGSNHYMPEWMKRDPAKYPNITGKDGKEADSPSPHSEDAKQADIRAFTAVMHYLKNADKQHTVIMIQVENESGSWGSVRDYSPKAQKLFEGNVPSELLKPDLLKAVNATGSKGSWQQVFGARADEYFHAWSVARYIGQVAAAGKAEYPLPMYTNAALRDPLTNPTADTYESGGPTDNVIPIWKAAAPSLDLVAPDFYLQGSERALKVFDLYDRPDNPLFVPEIGLSADNAKYLFTVIAHGGLGFSPFGIDGRGRNESSSDASERLSPYADEYEAISPLLPDLAQWAHDGKVRAIVEHEDHGEQTTDLGAWQAVVSFGTGRGNAMHPNARPDGKILIVKQSENKFLVIGSLCHITFHLLGANAGKFWQYLKVEEGVYENGAFQPLRILNGDETDWGGPRFGAKPAVLEISLVVRSAPR